MVKVYGFWLVTFPFALGVAPANTACISQEELVAFIHERSTELVVIPVLEMVVSEKQKVVKENVSEKSLVLHVFSPDTLQ